MTRVRIRKSPGTGIQVEAEICSSPSTEQIVVATNYKVIDQRCRPGYHTLWIGHVGGGPITFYLDGATHQGDNRIIDELPSSGGWEYEIAVEA